MGFPWVGGVTVLIYLAGPAGISDEVIDSSLVDGCSGLRRIFSIDIPLILGQFKLIIVLAVIGGLQGWVAVFVMTAGGAGDGEHCARAVDVQQRLFVEQDGICVRD